MISTQMASEERLAFGASEFSCVSLQAKFYKKSESIGKLIKACKRCKEVNPFVSELLGKIARRVDEKSRASISIKVRERKNTIDSASKRVYESVEEQSSSLKREFESLVQELPEDSREAIKIHLRQPRIDTDALLSACQEVGFGLGSSAVQESNLKLQEKCQEVVESLKENGADQMIVGVVSEETHVARGKLRENNKKWYHFNHGKIRFFCKIDGLLEDGTPVEMKTRRNRIFDDIPHYERIQLYIIMRCLSAPKILVRQVCGNETKEMMVYDYECQPSFTKAYSDFCLMVKENDGVEKMCRNYIDMASDDEISSLYEILFG